MRRATKTQAVRVMRWLIERGQPASANEIAAALQMSHGMTRIVLHRHGDIFVRRPLTDNRWGTERVGWVAWEE